MARFGSRATRAASWVLRRALAVLGMLALALAAALAGVLLHLDLPAPRRVTCRLVTNLLNDFFEGQLRIGRIERLSLRRITATNIAVRDTQQRQVLEVSRLRVRTNLARIAEQLWWGGPKETIIIHQIRIEQAECELLPDREVNQPSLVRAFSPRPTWPPQPPSEHPRHIRVWMPVIEIGKLWARGQLGQLPTLEAKIHNVHGSVLASPKGAAVDVRRFGAIVRGFRGTDARGTGELHVRVPGPLWTSFNGRLGDVELGAFARVDGKRLQLRLELPDAEPRAVRALWSQWPLQRPLRAQVEATGEPARMQAQGTFELGNAQLSAAGTVRLTEDPGLDLDVEARRLDLRTVLASAPQTELDLRAAVAVWHGEAGLVATVNGTTLPTTAAGMAWPAVDLRGNYDTHGFRGEATLHEPGMPVKVNLAVSPDGKLEVEAHAPAFRIQGAPRLARYTDLDAHAHLDLRAHVEGGRFSATVDAGMDNLRARQVQLQQGHLTGTVEGPLAEPLKWNLDARVAVTNISAGWLGFEQVEAHATGSPRAARVTARLQDAFGPNVVASGLVLPFERTARDVTLAVTRRGVGLEGQLAELSLGEQQLEVRELRLTGAGGTLEGSLRVHPDLLHVQASGEHLDLGRIAHALGLPRGTLAGSLNFSADVSAGEELSRGRIRVAVGDATLGPVGGVTASVGADLSRDRFEGTASVIVADRGVLGATWDTRLGGPVLQRESWRDLVGRAEVYLGKVNLSHAERLFDEDLGIEQVDGEAFGQIRLQRSRPDALPDVRTVLATKRLRVARAAPQATGTDQAGLVVEDIDVQVGANVSGQTGESQLTLRLVDSQGLLAVGTATSQLDLERLLAEPETAATQLSQTPLSAVLTVPDRPVHELPERLRPQGLEGKVSGRLTLGGSLSEPILNATVTWIGLRSQQSRYALPVDLRLAAQYEKRTGRFGGHGEALQAGRRVMLLSTRGTAPWQLLTGADTGSTPAWQGEAEILLEGLPLPVVPALADNQVGGTLDGTIALQRHGQTPRARASLRLQEASVEDMVIGDGSLVLSSDGKHITARLGLGQEQQSLTVKARGALAWTRGWPRLDETQPALIDLHARRFDAIVLQPLLRGALSRLSGEVDADLQAELRQRSSSDQPEERKWDGEFRGSARVRKGLLQLAGLGLTLRDVSLEAQASYRNEHTVIRISQLRGKARSESHNLQGNATLYLDGLRFSHGQAQLRTVEEDVPLLVQGVSLATVAGQASARLEHQDDRMLVRVTVPDLRARLPRSSERQLISLDQNANIAVAQPLGEPEQPRSGDALPWRLVFELGRDVRIVRSDLYVPITGQPVVNLGEQTLVSGHIDLEPGGRLQALGKDFEIRSGQLRFDTGDNSDPHLDAIAAWQAPAATVYVEIHGTLQEAELTFRSEPPRPEQEVIALLLGASDEEGEPGQEGAQTGVALGAGSQAAAPILDKLFLNTPLSGIKFRATATAGKPSYTAAYRISDQVWLEGIYRPEGGLSDTESSGGEDLSGQGRQDAFAGAIDYRFSRNWSLRTEAGNASAGLDILWQYRY